MDFFRRVVFGQAEDEPQPPGVETIQNLCDRLASSMLLQDRRDAVRALKSLSKASRVEVGKLAMEPLVHIMKTDSLDTEILGYALDTLCIICNEDDVPDENTSLLTDKFIQDSEHVTLVLALLEEFDFHVRWPGVKLLTTLLKNKRVQVQGIILASPMGVSRLVDLLADAREVIRNDGLLLLQQLTKGNPAIQKIVVFENAFERLLDIVLEGGGSDGDIVVEDCLLLLLNLLKNNSSNQNFFKESSYIRRMKPWFEVSYDNPCWSAQKVTNLQLMLQLVRLLVCPTNTPQATASCQESMYQCGLLQQLCTILMAPSIPAEVLTEILNTLSEVIRGSRINQDYFASVSAPSNPPRPAVVGLLMSMVNESQPFALRLAVLYCFQCLLYKNEKAQAEIVATLLPSSASHSISAGRLLCGGLFSANSVTNWCAAVALAYTLRDNVAQKEQLLCVQLCTSLGQPPLPLLQHCTSILLSQCGKVQTRVGLLILLCTWTRNCPAAVSQLLQGQETVPFLTGQISENAGEDERLVQGLCALLLGICMCHNDDSLESYTKEKLKELVDKRIGKESFAEKLGFIAKHELYSRAARKPEPAFLSPEQMLFDHEFTKLVREMESVIAKVVHKSSEDDKKEEEDVKKTLEHRDSIATCQHLIEERDAQVRKLSEQLASMTTCQHLIEERDAQIRKLSEQLASMTSQNEQMKTTIIQQQRALIQQHKDQYDKLKLTTDTDNRSQANNSHSEVTGPQAEELSQLREEVQELRKQHTLLRAQLHDKDVLIDTLRSDRCQNVSTIGQEHTELIQSETPRSQCQPAEVEQLQMTESQELKKRAEGGLTETILSIEGLADSAKMAAAESQLAQLGEKLEEVTSLSEDDGAGQQQQLASDTSSGVLLQSEEFREQDNDPCVPPAHRDQKIENLQDPRKTTEDEETILSSPYWAGQDPAPIGLQWTAN